MLDYSKYDTAIGLNWYDTDPNLRAAFQRILSKEDLAWAEPWLRKWGALCGGPIAERAEVTDKNPPKLLKYDRWGEEINDVIHHQSALDTKRDLWDTGFNGLPWSDEAKRRGRPVPAAVMTAYSYFLAQAETGMLCAIGMTTGVAELIEKFGDDRVKAEFLPHLRAMSYEGAWDGAMFLTEKTGGSDLGVLTTTARKKGDAWLLTGLKWFCSNVDARAIVTLARPEGAPDGIKGVGLFLVPKIKRDGNRNGIHIRRIKDKLGTKAVPTAEVDFIDAEAYPLSGGSENVAEHGINRMMEMVNVSRLGVAIMGAGIARRAFLEAAIYASKRSAFGRPLTDWPLMKQDLARIQVDADSAASMVFECARAADEVRNNADEEAARYLRILVPLAKIRATRQGLECSSRALEVAAGNGYIEDWPLARQYRDAQCHTIWEGTDNILVLDMMRALMKYQAHESVIRRVEGILKASSTAQLEPARKAARQKLDEAIALLGKMSTSERDEAIGMTKVLAETLCDAVQCALLTEEAEHELTRDTSARKVLVALSYAQRRVSGMNAGADPAAGRHFESVFHYGKVSPKDL